jgi:hypothetical protein
LFDPEDDKNHRHLPSRKNSERLNHHLVSNWETEVLLVSLKGISNKDSNHTQKLHTKIAHRSHSRQYSAHW